MWPSRATTTESDASSLGYFDYNCDSFQTKATGIAGAVDTFRLNELCLSECKEPFLKNTKAFYPSLAVKSEYDICSVSV